MVEVRGVEIDLDRSGSGPTFVWGHGLTSSRANEDESRLIDWPAVRRRADVVRYDARGHGRSGFSVDPEGYSWQQLALDQLAILDELGIDRAAVGGASMGAATALHTAVVSPERVERLVLVIPPTGWETRAAQIDIYRQMADVVEHRGVEPLIAASAELPPPDPFAGSAEWRDLRAASMRRADPVRLAGLYRGAATADLPPPSAIESIRCPTLILAWSGDPGHPVSSAERLDSLLPDAHLSVASTAAELSTWTRRVIDFVAG
jgi:pimeloyl-ACP methyl ester carboxylesterase